MGIERISAILYRHDPANTCCNVCEDMEDEYDRIAAEIARIPERPLSFEAFRDVLAEAAVIDEHIHRSMSPIEFSEAPGFATNLTEVFFGQYWR